MRGGRRPTGRDRRRRRAALAAAELLEQLREEPERHAGTRPSGRGRARGVRSRRAAPPSRPQAPLQTDSLHGLDVVQARREQERDPTCRSARGRSRRGVLGDPVPLLVVEDRAPALLEHAAGPRVHDDQAGARRGRGRSSRARPRLLVGGRARRTRAGSRLASSSPRAPARRARARRARAATGCRCAGRSSTPSARRRSRSCHHGLRSISSTPRARDVPVVVHVVVVDHHRVETVDSSQRIAGRPRTRGTGACTPRSSRPPRQAARRCRASARMYSRVRRRALVDVDLVAQHQQQVAATPRAARSASPCASV